MKIVNSKHISLFAYCLLMISLNLSLTFAAEVKKAESTLSYIKPTYAKNAREFQFPDEHFNNPSRKASSASIDEAYVVVPTSPKKEVADTNLQHAKINKENNKYIEKNQYTASVKIQNAPISEAGFETPTIIPRKDKFTSSVHSAATVQPVQVSHEVPVANLRGEIEKDIKTFMAQFDNAKDKQERTEILKKGKTRIHAEILSLSNEIEDHLKELLFAKEVALKLNNLLGNYHQKIKENKLSELKLSDTITIKKLLADKIQREIQGFRTSPSEYKELDMVNPSDVTKIIHDIKLKLGE